MGDCSMRPGTSGVVTVTLLTLASVACDRPSPDGGEKNRPAVKEDGLKPTSSLHEPLPTSPSNVGLSLGQMLYIPMYSSIHTKNYSWQGNLASTLSVRNTSLDRPISVGRVDYFDSRGKPVQSYLAEPLTLQPLESKEFLVEAKDLRGGMSAMFLVEWSSTRPVTQPVVEAVNIFMSIDKSFAFTSHGRVLRENER